MHGVEPSRTTERPPAPPASEFTYEAPSYDAPLRALEEPGDRRPQTSRAPGPTSIEPPEYMPGYSTESAPGSHFSAGGTPIVPEVAHRQPSAPMHSAPVPTPHPPVATPLESQPLNTHTEDFFRRGDEGSYEGGPRDLEARRAALSHLEREAHTERDVVTLPPGVLQERQQKYTKVVLAVVGVCALLVIIASVLKSFSSSDQATVPAPTAPAPEVQASASDKPDPTDAAAPAPQAEEVEQVPASDPAPEDEAPLVEVAPRPRPSTTTSSTSPAPAPSPTPAPSPSPAPAPSVDTSGPSSTRAVERAKATLRPSDNPPSAGFPEPTE